MPSVYDTAMWQNKKNQQVDFDGKGKKLLFFFLSILVFALRLLIYFVNCRD